MGAFSPLTRHHIHGDATGGRVPSRSVPPPSGAVPCYVPWLVALIAEPVGRYSPALISGAVADNRDCCSHLCCTHLDPLGKAQPC